MSGPTLLPFQIKQRCNGEARAIVDLTNNASGKLQVTDSPIVELITKCTSIMLQIKVFILFFMISLNNLNKFILN